MLAVRRSRVASVPSGTTLLLVTLAVVALGARQAQAAPQANAGLRAGVCGASTDSIGWPSTCFYGGGQADVILGRQSSRDFGVGPYGQIATADFADLRLGGGASVHVPIDPTFPLVLSGGGVLQAADGGWHPGLGVQLFLGGRSYNYHGPYVMAPGIVVGLDYGLDSRRERLLSVALHLDAQLLALPAIAIASWLRGDPEP